MARVQVGRVWLGLEGTVVVGGGLVIWLCRGLGLVIVVVGGRQGTLSYGGRGTAKLVVQGKVLRRDAELEREAGEERQEREQCDVERDGGTEGVGSLHLEDHIVPG